MVSSWVMDSVLALWNSHQLSFSWRWLMVFVEGAVYSWCDPFEFSSNVCILFPFDFAESFTIISNIIQFSKIAIMLGEMGIDYIQVVQWPPLDRCYPCWREQYIIGGNDLSACYYTTRIHNDTLDSLFLPCMANNSTSCLIQNSVTGLVLYLTADALTHKASTSPSSHLWHIIPGRYHSLGHGFNYLCLYTLWLCFSHGWWMNRARALSFAFDAMMFQVIHGTEQRMKEDRISMASKVRSKARKVPLYNELQASSIIRKRSKVKVYCRWGYDTLPCLFESILVLPCYFHRVHTLIDAKRKSNPCVDKSSRFIKE